MCNRLSLPCTRHQQLPAVAVSPVGTDGQIHRDHPRTRANRIPTTCARPASGARSIESAFLSHSAGTDAGAANRPQRAREAGVPRAEPQCMPGGALSANAALEGVGLNRTYDMLHNLDQSVAVACRRS